MIEHRLMECEAKLAYHEDTLRVLNEVVTRQSQQIEQLQMVCRQLAERVARATDSVFKGSAEDEIPPHY